MGRPISTKQVVYVIIILLSLIGMTFVSFYDLNISQDLLISELSEGIHVRVLGTIVFALLMALMGYSLLQYRPVHWKMFVYVVLPGIIIAINNLPIIAFLDDRAMMTESLEVFFLFVLFCISIGLFEEVVFRGLILTVLLQRLPETKQGILIAIVLSSLIFGVIHFVNLVAGASPLDTLLQIGYSFLMGMLWAVVYLKTKNLWMAILLHAMYNMSGLVFVQIGYVYGRYDILTIITTVLVGIIGIYYYMRIYLTIEPEDIKELYEPTISN